MEHTAEWVSPNHPDKVCDCISDAILDACLIQDPDSRVAVETQAGHGTIFLAWEITTKADLDFHKIVHDTLDVLHIDWRWLTVMQNIAQQSPDISKGVDTCGAGDQGIMVGYATNENEQMLPMEFYWAKELGRYIWEQTGRSRDLKTQVTTKYGKVSTVLVSAEGFEGKIELTDMVYAFFASKKFIANDVAIIINPCGSWKGWFNTDSGLTGRKIVVDQYGPRIPVGGGAFSGKDPTKVDRSAAYMARKVAREILMNTQIAHIQTNQWVSGYIQDRQFPVNDVMVQVAYAIGMDTPLSLHILINGEYHIEPTEALLNRFKPKNIIEELKLWEPHYLDMILNGNYGNPDRPWEA